MAWAMVFPGQGSQSLGMLHDALPHAVVAATLAQASEVLGCDVPALMRDGPLEQLNRTEWTQPILLAASVALYRLWRAEGGAEPDYMAGHSLGEYSALVCAGALDYAEALQLVRERGRLMQSAVPAGVGLMAAILGLEDAKVVEICRAASAEQAVVEAVNFNAPGQVVIAGHRAAVIAAMDACKAAGAKRALELAVSVPAHSSLMQPAAQQLAVSLAACQLRLPQIRVLHNIDAAPASDVADLQQRLLRQLYHPVQWVATGEALRAHAVTQVLECGPGKVLVGLMKRIDGLQVLPLDGEAARAEAHAALAM